jgi:hypothetical protein
MNHAFEIIGRVTNDLSVRVDQALDFGADYGMSVICLKHDQMLTMVIQTSIHMRQLSMQRIDIRKCSMEAISETK